MIPIWGAAALVFAAGTLGVLLAALMCAAAEDERELEARERAGLDVDLDPLMSEEPTAETPKGHVAELRKDR